MKLIEKLQEYFCKEKSELQKRRSASATEKVFSAKDLPSTVQPLTPETQHVAELRRAFAGQKWDAPAQTTAEVYIWRKADEFIKQWLPQKGYMVLKSEIFNDCIGYRCNRKGHTYTIFMYAYGEQKTALLDGEYCNKFKSFPFAHNSTILVVYLKVDRNLSGNSTEYIVGQYGNADSEPELWKLQEVDGKPILEYYICKEMEDQLWQFMYAFNRENTDIYDCIIMDDNPSIEGDPKCSGIFLNEAFYATLRSMHREYGDMKLGYVRYNDVVYSSVPYVEGLGFFGWRVFHANNRMNDLICYPFEGGERKTAEFIKTEQREPDNLFASIPKLVKAVALPAVPTERFAVKLFFDNGECRKYVLPIHADDENAEVVSYLRHMFSDGIWKSVVVVPSHKSRYEGYPECGEALSFKNGFFIAGTRCYMESKPYSEPEMVDEMVYSDESYLVRKIWMWDINALVEDRTTGLLKVLLSGQAFNGYGKSVFATVEGKRMTSLEFDVIDDFKEGLVRVAVGGYGYGFVDQEMQLAVPMQYDAAEDFQDGKAIVRSRDKWFLVDKTGRETKLGEGVTHADYQEVGDYYEGMCRVSILKLRQLDLAYHTDYDEIAGIWGFVNEEGKEVISPQYIYAEDFEDGIAIVAKGKWTIDPKWNNKYNQGRYWTSEELWGAINKDGNEVIPFIFDEIKHFDCRTDMFRVHYGGWKDGHWGVIDNQGHWLAEPVFEELFYDSCNDLIVFYAEDPDAMCDDILMGIYDIRQKKVLFEPQFISVNFLENDDMIVEVFDKELGRTIEKIIDSSGKERFKSVYSSIYTWKDPYEVVIRDKDGTKHGLIDKDGNEIIPCIYDTPWNGLFHEQKRICFIENGKQGMKDYNGNTVIPAIYHEVYGRSEPFYTVQVGTNDNHKEGLITHAGKTVIPAKYERISWCKDHKHFFCGADGCFEMYAVEDRMTAS